GSARPRDPATTGAHLPAGTEESGDPAIQLDGAVPAPAGAGRGAPLRQHLPPHSPAARPPDLGAGRGRGCGAAAPARAAAALRQPAPRARGFARRAGAGPWHLAGARGADQGATRDGLIRSFDSPPGEEHGGRAGGAVGGGGGGGRRPDRSPGLRCAVARRGASGPPPPTPPSPPTAAPPPPP